ncbi:MAG TPA: thymidine phosphorylase, partial [Myxococcota bacterium]|nr:thymidine phosphorylase [Myxococcota bacterium]
MIDEILRARRAKQPLSDSQIQTFVNGVVDGSVSRPQAAAFLAFTFLNGMTDAEAVALTRAMTDSGERLSWDFDGPFVDKHSTGGVGDKVSLVLAPLWAELGLKVPMISGRGLGHTGGTLDKLESIPGFRTDLDEDALRRTLREVGCFMNGQTTSLAPSDRILYALRNETQTVECIPLIVGSILSKKLAEGLDRLVLDVKVGSGAFMQTEEDALALARALVRVGNGAGVHTRALLTDMEQPLGELCGNALEVIEAVECLKGGGPPDLRALTIALAGHPDAAKVLDSGAAY